ncbi:MAG: Hsp20/alpha crystallin family protein [Cyanobacteria bacterium P01_D01_bin.36]
MLVRRYWQPFSEMNTVKQQLDQLFDELTHVEGAPTTWTPAATLVESEDALTLHVQLPGVNADEIDIQASREVVAVSGSRPVLEVGEGEKLRRNEFRYGSFRRVVSLPEAIDHTAVSANYEAGILVLHLPKAEEARNKVVKVSVAGATPAIDDTAETVSDAAETAQ